MSLSHDPLAVAHPALAPCPKGLVSCQVDLLPYCYYGLAGTARYFALPTNLFEVQQLVNWAQCHSLPLAVLGVGSNLAFQEGTFEGLVLCMQHMNRWHWPQPDLLWAEAGVCNTEVADAAWEQGRWGASWLFRMPGSLGGTLRMNARCFGGEISQIVYGVQSIDRNGNVHYRSAQEVFYGYKDTLYMKNPEIITGCLLSLPNIKPRHEIKTHMEYCEQQRLDKHHFDYPSCGSTFKNNYDLGRPSGQVFDELGFKGTQQGGLRVSPHHANFIFNLSGGTATELLSLASTMRKAAFDHTNGHNLDLEVELVGAFPTALAQACGLVGTQVTQDTVWLGTHGAPWESQGNSSTPALQQVNHPLGHLSSPFLSDLILDSRQADVPFIQAWEHLQGQGGAPASKLWCAVTQLQPLSYAVQNPKAPFLKWETISPSESVTQACFTTSPPLPGGSFCDKLWHYCVAELFLASHQNPALYFEFEITPQQHWLALGFEAVRRRSPVHQQPAQNSWPGVQTFFTPQPHALSWGLLLSYETLEPLLSANQNTLLVQGAISLKNGLETFVTPGMGPLNPRAAGAWNQKTKSLETQHPVGFPNPDFHQPQRFWTLYLR